MIVACAITVLNGLFFIGIVGAIDSPYARLSIESECFTSLQVDSMVQEAIRKETPIIRQQIRQEFMNPVDTGRVNDAADKDNDNEDSKTKSKYLRQQALTELTPNPRFPDGMHNLVVAMAKVDRDDFTKKFDLGVPLDRSDPSNNEVLLMYSHHNAVPSDPVSKQQAISQSEIPKVSAEDATANCDFLNIVFQHHDGRRRQCMAIMGQHEAYHIQKYMRLPEWKEQIDSTHPLVLANRDANENRKLIYPPYHETTKQFWLRLQQYLGDLDNTLDILRSVLKKVAVRNTIIVMMCNFGQVELLLNFVCSAKRRGLDTSSVVVFATDQETATILNNLGGPTVVYLKNTFAGMPTKAAKAYGNNDYSQMMLAKIYCVHLPVLLGYDVLFQDVDVVWYRNPLDFFHNTSRKDASFDLYFQDDGNRVVYQTYSANTGFYYVRNNRRTIHFFNSLLMMGGDVLSRRSHQMVLQSLLQEQASLFALKIKVYSRDEDLFPGGYTYRRDRDYMKKFVKREVHPIIFHMSWTASKVDKLKFFQQMGEWFIADKCTSISSRYDESNLQYENCCLDEPHIVCHESDKPSIIPCPNSTFW